MLRLGLPFIEFFQVIDVEAMVMPSCKRGASTPSFLIIIITKHLFSVVLAKKSVQHWRK